jgi:hypothetical protein
LWAENKKTFAQSLFCDLELRFYNSTILNYFGFFTNIFIIKKGVQSTKIFSKIISQDQVIGKWFSYIKKVPEHSIAKSKVTNSARKDKGSILVAFYGQHFFEYQKHQVANPRAMLFSAAKKRSIFPFFSSQTVCNYIADQLSNTTKFKDKSFKISLQKGIAKVAAQLSKKINFRTISGVKIVCSGK